MGLNAYINNPANNGCSFSEKSKMRKPFSIASISFLCTRNSLDSRREWRQYRLQSFLVGFLARGNYLQKCS